jgi:predicted nucleic acid-binding protein
MKVVIDTNVYIAIENEEKIEKLLYILEKADEIIVPTIVFGELYHGF